MLRNQNKVFPTNIQARVTDIAHEGHGLTKSKEFLRTKVRFNRLDKQKGVLNFEKIQIKLVLKIY